MGVNDLEFNQLATLLAAINKQATGKDSLATVNDTNFVSVAQATLKFGYDPVLQAISQVIGRTVFSIRPYSMKFKGLRMDEQKWGNATRKVGIADKPFETDDRFNLEDGQAVDMYRVNKPDILQTNIYGSNVVQKSLTIFKDQLDSAFTGPGEFGQFIAMITGNATDMLEQARENMARASVCNFIAGKIQYDEGNVVHLLSEYNAATGLSLTATTVYQPANFPAFIKWVYGRVAAISSLLTERSVKYHINVTNFGGTVSDQGVVSGGVDKSIMRHTPEGKQKVYLFAGTQYQADSMVLADTFHDNYLKYADVEMVNFWQAINNPAAINVIPIAINSAGLTVSPNTAVSKTNVFGVIFDEEAMGVTSVNRWSGTTPFNVRGGYSNMFFHETTRYYNDFTENGVVFLLD